MSVVLPVFNRVGVVGRALDSVRAQTFEDYEIIVVDDGSTDGSADFVQSLGISKIRVIRCPENRGAAAARNLSVAAASGHYIAFLNSDNSWEPNKLALQVAALENAAPDSWRAAPIFIYGTRGQGLWCEPG